MAVRRGKIIEKCDSRSKWDGEEQGQDNITEARARGMGLREPEDKQGEIMKEKMLLRESTEETKMKGKNKEEKQGRETRTN